MLAGSLLCFCREDAGFPGQLPDGALCGGGHHIFSMRHIHALPHPCRVDTLDGHCLDKSFRS